MFLSHFSMTACCLHGCEPGAYSEQTRNTCLGCMRVQMLVASAEQIQNRLNDSCLPYSLHLGQHCRTEEYRRFSGGHLQRPDKVLCIHPAIALHNDSNNWQ